jgi:hypothetical protein
MFDVISLQKCKDKACLGYSFLRQSELTYVGATNTRFILFVVCIKGQLRQCPCFRI